jgi:hypothetical protein
LEAHGDKSLSVIEIPPFSKGRCGERVNILKYKKKFPPPWGGGVGGGEIRDFFSASGGSEGFIKLA